MVLSYAFCNVSLLPVHAAPSHRSEVVNQMLFGERAEVLQVNEGEWALIRSEWDGYEGWCKFGQLGIVTKKEYCKEPKYITASAAGKLIFEDESEMWLPAGSELFHFKGGKININKKIAKYKGKKLPIEELELNIEQLIAAALYYKNTPYVWGGRSTAGIDCSGLVQMAFKMCGKAVPRDASQQALQGDAVDFLQNAKTGDLAFFDNAEGNITHVGILLNSNSIIHATDTTGRVVIDRIDQGGIISKILRRRTHNLRVVKRFF